MAQKRILLAGLFHETHTFLESTTALSDFAVRRGPELLLSEDDGSPLAGALAVARECGWQVLPAMDPATHTVQVRLDLPPGTRAAPGMFGRVWLPGRSGDTPRLSVPTRAVVRRAELTGVYVLGDDGRPLLRQVRLGPVSGDQVEVLSGLRAGERVALDPQAAARVR